MYDEGFVDKLEKEINANIGNIFEDKDILDKVAKLISIHANIIVEQTHKGQLAMLKQSQELAKNIDFSKIDLNALLSNLRGS